MSRPERDAPRYVQTRPTDIRVAKAGNRNACHIKTLPKHLETLSAELRVGHGDRLLDYGCADVPYRGFFAPGAEYTAADLPGNPGANLILNDDGTVPCPDNTFDAVMSTQVLEHVTDPELYLSEAYRVLRPGGRMLLSTHGVFIYHPDPDDYWRWTCAGLQRVVRQAGFEVVRFEGIIGLLPTGLQLVQDAVYWRLPRGLRRAFALVMQSLISLSDRLHTDDSRAMNAQVFALVAEKPE
jgi:SAM-dependent methyltransferase